MTPEPVELVDEPTALAADAADVWALAFGLVAALTYADIRWCVPWLTDLFSGWLAGLGL